MSGDRVPASIHIYSWEMRSTHVDNSQDKAIPNCVMESPKHYFGLLVSGDIRVIVIARLDPMVSNVFQNRPRKHEGLCLSMLVA